MIVNLIFIQLCNSRHNQVIEHWGQYRRFTLPSFNFPVNFQQPVQSTIKKIDMILANNEPTVTMPNDVHVNELNVRNELKIGEAIITKDTNSNMSIGSSNIGIDINKNTLFKKPVLINDSVSEVALKGTAFVDAKTHLYGDFHVNDKFCFFNSNDNNCLLKDDVEYIYYSSNYINKAKVALSACISRGGLQTVTDNYLQENNIDVINGSDSNTATLKQSKNIPLDDEMICIGKKDTMKMLSNWANVSTEMKSSEIEEDSVTNICTRDDIEIQEVYRYNNTDFVSEGALQSSINGNECNNCGLCTHTDGGPCTINVNYDKQITFTNKNTATCDFEDTATRMDTIAYQCAQKSYKYNLNGVCYTLTTISTNDILDKKTKFKSGTAYIKDLRHKIMTLGDGAKEFRIRP